MNYDLASMDSFGDVAAEDDAVLDYFLTTDAVTRIQRNEVFLVLGRKGAGKTAIVRHFTESSTDSPSRAINLRSYPWNIHASRIDRGASDVEAYVASWRYFIAVELASLTLNQKGVSDHPLVKSIRKFLDDNYGGADPTLGDILRPRQLKLNSITIEPTVLGNKLGKVALDRSSDDLTFGRELDEVSTALIDAVTQIVKDASIDRLLLHFDELDQGLSQLDQKRSTMIVGLILAAREVKRVCAKAGTNISPVVFLRTDLWNELKFSDKNKISQTQALHLEWDSNSLRQLVNARLQAKLHSNCTWENVASPKLMRGSQTKWNHILARSFLRPRDIIKFLNTALLIAKRSGRRPLVFENEDIVAAREEYSAYLKAELDDEVLPHWPHWEEALQACSDIATMTFTRDQFTEAYRRRKSQANTVSEDDALRLLYRFSILGYERRSGYGGSTWAFYYTDPEAGWDNSATRFKVHLGLKEYAKLREERR